VYYVVCMFFVDVTFEIIVGLLEASKVLRWNEVGRACCTRGRG
jgi:hypothetical protein